MAHGRVEASSAWILLPFPGDVTAQALRLGGQALMTDVVERANVRMIQCRDRASFALETLAPIRVACDVGGEHLNGCSDD